MTIIRNVKAVAPLAGWLERESAFTIATVAAWTRGYLAQAWRPLLREHREKLLGAFDRAGEAAYGTWWSLLTRPLGQEFARAGLRTQPAFPGNLVQSFEPDAPPASRERFMWYVVTPVGADIPIGTLVIASRHDHTRFRVPKGPRVLALRAVDERDIVSGLCDRVGCHPPPPR